MKPNGMSVGYERNCHPQIDIPIQTLRITSETPS